MPGHRGEERASAGGFALRVLPRRAGDARAAPRSACRDLLESVCGPSALAWRRRVKAAREAFVLSSPQLGRGHVQEAAGPFPSAAAGPVCW